MQGPVPGRFIVRNGALRKMPKHIRGKRARARQRSRYDFRDRYRQSDIPVENIGIIRIVPKRAMSMPQAILR